jgi:hypothetical protein
MTTSFEIKGGFIFRYHIKFLVITSLLFIFITMLLGFMFNVTIGLIEGLAFSIFITIILSKWGEKIVLVFSKARYVSDDEALINQVKNFCTHLRIVEVKIYWSNTYVNNIYYSDSFFGKPVLIIGKNINDVFSKNELNSLIYASLLKIKNNEARCRTMISLYFLILNSPIFILISIFKNTLLKDKIEFFLYPSILVKSYFNENKNRVASFDAEVGRLSGLRKDYVSALFKLSCLPSYSEKSAGEFLITDLTHARNNSNDALLAILTRKVEIKVRIKELSSN